MLLSSFLVKEQDWSRISLKQCNMMGIDISAWYSPMFVRLCIKERVVILNSECVLLKTHTHTFYNANFLEMLMVSQEHHWGMCVSVCDYLYLSDKSSLTHFFFFKHTSFKTYVFIYISRMPTRGIKYWLGVHFTVQQWSFTVIMESLCVCVGGGVRLGWADNQQCVVFDPR